MSKTLRNLLVLVVILGIVVVASTFAPSAHAATATGASISLVSPVKGTIEVGQVWNVRWSTRNYPSKTVSVNLIKKVSSNPNTYALVRTVAASTPNDGKATWVASSNDVGSSVSLEIGCARSKVACVAGDNTSSALAVVPSTRYSNTAAAFKAIEQSKNK